MMAVDFLTSAQAELDGLLPLRAWLTESLAFHAARFKDVGALPAEDLVQGLQDYRRRLLDLSNNLLAVSDQMGWSPVDAGDICWESLCRALQSYRSRTQATERLNLVAALRHKDDPRFAPLLECQQSALILRQAHEQSALSGSSRTALDQLNSAEHPLNALLNLVTDGGDLPDDVWTVLNDRVIETFGRSMATAVARGKIELGLGPSGSAGLGAENSTAVDFTESDDTGTVSGTQIHRSETTRVGVLSPDEPKGIPTAAAQPIPPAITDSIVEPSSHATEIPGSVLTEVQEGQIAGEPDRDSRELSFNGSKATRAQQSMHFDAAISQDVQPAVEPLISARGDTDALTHPGSPPVAGNIEITSALHQDLDESIFDAIGQSTTDNSLGHSDRLPQGKLLSEQPFRWIQAEATRTSSAAVTALKVSFGNTALLARNAIQVDGDARHTQLSQLVLQLLSQDRLALAYHLTRGIESRLQGFQTVLPSRLIHALVFSRHICYARGEIARKVEEDLKAFSPHVLTSGDAEWNEATGLFVRAAALIPALLTSSPTATTILRTFRITPGLSHLYNYCSRLSTYGHRLQGQASDLFTPDCDLTNWENETTALQQSIATWLADSIQKSCPTSRSSLLFLHAHWTLTNGSVSRFAESARLWSKWQECFRIVHRLLKPALYGHEQDRSWVKTEIDRITQSVRLEPSVSELNQPLPLGSMTFPLEAMLKTIREGVDFASRWLRLCASKPAQGRTLASREAESLRDEILERTDAVITELAEFSRQHPAPRMQAGVACLSGTIEHLRAIFSPHSTLALCEADLRHVLYGELLKIPNLKMNEQWIPTVDTLTLENEILAYLGGDAYDWKRAFEMQCSQRDHVATDRILQLNVWRTDLERETLKRRRTSEIQVCRDELQQELTDLQQGLLDPSQQFQLNPTSRAEFEKRVQRLQATIDSTVDFAAIHNEVNQLRLSIEKQKRDSLHIAKRASAANLVLKSVGAVRWNESPEAAPAAVQDSWALNILSDN